MEFPSATKHEPCYRRPAPDAKKSGRGWKSQKKPEWVPREVVRLAALMPGAGCRRIAATFNALWSTKRDMTVGKSYVANKLKAHKYDVLRLRRRIKNRIPRPIDKNVIWGLDWTFIDEQPVLGIVDHGSRANLALLPLRTKATLTILRVLLDCFEVYGVPKSIRTDNEACFTSRLMTWTLKTLGIRHQRSEVRAPWQNGRIERLFGTLKPLLKERLRQDGAVDLGRELSIFRFWYNQVRQHQHLDGQTPAEVWSGRQRSRADKHAHFSAWNGLLTGFFRRE